MKGLLDKINTKLNAQGGFLKAVSLLAGSTAFAQAITFLALPIITRLYTPQDFSAFAVYSAILGVMAVVACLRLDVAISLPDKDESAANLLVLSLLCSTVFSIICLVIVIIFSHQITSLLSQPELGKYLWTLPFVIWLTSTYSVFQNWATRKKYFSSIASTKMVQASVGSGVQIGMGFWGLGSLGLIIGQIFLSGVGIAGLAKRTWRQDRYNFQLLTKKTMLYELKKYDQFPKYSTLESFVNSAAIQFPLILIASIAIGPEAGYLLLAMKVMSAPLGLIGKAISQVYLSHAAEEYRKNNSANFTADVIKSLLKMGVGPLIFIGLIAPHLFPLIFGKGWERAGELVMWMIPWMVLQFIASPISMAMHVRGWQKAMLALTLFGLVLRIGALYAAYKLNIEFLSEAYIVSGAIFYMICICIFFRAAEVRLKQVVPVTITAAPIITIWVILGLVITFILRYL